jgi:hypothetical protein
MRRTFRTPTLPPSSTGSTLTAWTKGSNTKALNYWPSFENDARLLDNHDSIRTKNTPGVWRLSRMHDPRHGTRVGLARAPLQVLPHAGRLGHRRTANASGRRRRDVEWTGFLASSRCTLTLSLLVSLSVGVMFHLISRAGAELS